MKYYQIKNVLSAAKSFARAKNGQKQLEEKLRTIESSKQNVEKMQVTEVSYQTIFETFSELVAAHCLADMMAALFSKMNELGYKAVEMESVPIYIQFEEKWKEVPEYQGYIPQETKDWTKRMEEFEKHPKYNANYPLPMNIIKDNNVRVVNLYGFIPVKTHEGQKTAHAALCKVVQEYERVAIRF